MADTDADILAVTTGEVSALRERVARLEALIEDLHVGVIVQGPNAEILVSNDAALRLLGLDEATLLGKTSFDPNWDVVRGDETPFPLDELPVPTAIRTGRAVQDVVVGVFRPAHNDRVWLMVSATPILDDDGHVARVLCTLSDVTERHRAETALRESEELNRRILDSAPAGIVNVSAGKKVVTANDEAYRILGLEAGVLIGQDVRDIIIDAVWEDGTALSIDACPSSRCIETGRRQAPTTMGLRRPDRSLAWAVFTAVPVFEPDSRVVTGAVVMFVDITERKRIEEQLRHIQRVEAVARLAGGVAHHFNNLLTVINGYASLMTKRLDPGDPLASDAAEIRKATDRAAQLTRQLLAFNRKHVTDRTAVNVNSTISDMRTMLAPLFGELIRFELALEADPATVWSDPTQVEDMVLNLAVNARDAMPSGGSFRLKTSNVVVDDTDVRVPGLGAGPYVVLRAADTGTGIEPGVCEHIFEPFFTTKEVGKGTGLGLSSVHEMVGQAGGRIEVRSEVGRGTEFTIYLPYVDAGQARETSSPVLDSRRGRETVLLVEDDDAVRTFLRETLLRDGYRVLEAANGATALDLCANYSGPIALLVTDIVMPEMGGVELARRLLLTRPQVRVLYISGYTDEDVGPLHLDSTAFDMLDKPFTTNELVGKLRLLLDGWR